jgi:hypothetical protein
MCRACSMHVDKKDVYMILVEKPEEKNPLEELDVGGRIILEFIFDRIE